MAFESRFSIVLAPSALNHLDAIEPKYHSLLKDKMAEQLMNTPTAVTRNRKPMDSPSPFDADWEIRFGPQNRFRVLYDVDMDSMTVNVLAIGVKVRNRLRFGGEEYMT